MNILDSSLHQNARFKDRWILCDVYAAAVAFDENCVKKSTKFLVMTMPVIIDATLF